MGLKEKKKKKDTQQTNVDTEHLKQHFDRKSW